MKEDNNDEECSTSTKTYYSDEDSFKDDKSRGSLKTEEDFDKETAMIRH